LKKHKLLLILLLFFAVKINAQSIVLQGKIQNFTNKESIPGASVSIKKLVKRLVNGDYLNDRIDYKNVSADTAGYYSIALPTGEYVLEITAVGFSKKSKFIDLKKSITLDLELNESTNQLDDLEVKARKAEANITDVQSGVIKLNIQGMKKLPVVFGEADVIKALTLQPGVTTVGEGAGGFNVRGGRVDQNLVLLDDAPLYNTSHLLGFFTSINAEAIQNATLYKAGIPANYGGRLSSLFNINTKTQTDTSRKALGIGIISSNVVLQESFANKKGSVMLAGRGAYPNWLIRQFPKNYRDSRADFYDINLAVQYRILPKQSIKLSAYRSGDNFKFPEDSSYFWKTQTATLQWSGIINNSLSFNVKGIYSSYIYGVNGLLKDYEFKFDSKILDRELKAGLVYQKDKWNIETGTSYKLYDFSPGNQNPTKAGSAIIGRNIAKEYGREIAAYVSSEYTISKSFSAQLGLRYVNYTNLGPGAVFNYKTGIPKTKESITDSTVFAKNESTFNFGGFEPRASLKYQFNGSSSLKLNYHRMRQFVHLISNTTAISPVDFWKLANTYIPPQQADQYALGYYKNFNSNKVQAYIEGFYKKYTNLVEYKDGADLLLNPHLETELLAANGLAYGVEFNLQKSQGRFTGNLSYTWSRSLIKVNTAFSEELVNQGKLYPSLFDKPHNVSAQADYYLGKGWTVASTFTYQTGRPVTFPDAQYYFGSTTVLDYSNRNKQRLPDFHRIDFSLSKDSRRNKDQKRYVITNFSLYNLYARRNPYSVFYKQYLGTAKAYRLAVLGTVVPSLTLTFYW
jgi:TonB dependent receptor/CarboxypepD_reg-like domain/TonB-dependent Receptor Plug Domain